MVSRGAILSIFGCLWFRGVLFLLFGCLWVCRAYLSVVSQGAILTICLSVVSQNLPDCGFTGHIVLRFFVSGVPVISGSFIFVEYYLLFPGMVQVSGEFPAPHLSASHMGPSSVVFLFGFLNSDVLAFFGLI